MYFLKNGKHFQTLSDLLDDVVLDFDNEIDYDLDATDNLPQPPTTNERTARLRVGGSKVPSRRR